LTLRPASRASAFDPGSASAVLHAFIAGCGILAERDRIPIERHECDMPHGDGLLPCVRSNAGGGLGWTGVEFLKNCGPCGTARDWKPLKTATKPPPRTYRVVGEPCGRIERQ